MRPPPIKGFNRALPDCYVNVNLHWGCCCREALLVVERRNAIPLSMPMRSGHPLSIALDKLYSKQYSANYPLPHIATEQKGGDCPLPHIATEQQGGDCPLPHIATEQQGDDCPLPHIAAEQQGDDCPLWHIATEQ